MILYLDVGLCLELKNKPLLAGDEAYGSEGGSMSDKETASNQNLSPSNFDSFPNLDEIHLNSVLANFEERNSVKVRSYADVSRDFISRRGSVSISDTGDSLSQVQQVKKLDLSGIEKNSDGTWTTSFNTPPHLTGAIIGPGGCNIKEIEQDFGCYSHINNERICVITGTKRNVSRGRDRIKKIIANKQQLTHINTKYTLRLPMNCVSEVIGPNGANTKNILNKTNCKIYINNETCDCDIVGPTYAIPKAVIEILKLVRSRMKKIIETRLKVLGIDQKVHSKISDAILDEDINAIQRFKSSVALNKLAEIEKSFGYNVDIACFKKIAKICSNINKTN